MMFRESKGKKKKEKKKDVEREKAAITVFPKTK
jgi:hypothetical protein